MANFHKIGEPVNECEREVLRLLRDGLDEDWEVVGNFGIRQGQREFDCDALAVSPGGWAYLIEAKAWRGRIVGNDADWLLPPLVGDAVTRRPNPVQQTQQKCRVVSTVVGEEDPPLKNVYVHPLVVLCSDDPPQLEGACADNTVLLSQLLDRVRENPRPADFGKRRFPEDAPARVANVLVRTSRPLTLDNRFGTWELVEQFEVGPSWEVWSARPAAAGPAARQMRLKRYLLDPLLTGEERRTQRDRARRDLDALQRLAAADGAVPLVGDVQEVDETFLVVTEWPAGESFASIVAQGLPNAEAASEMLDALCAAVASVHRLGIVHRNLSPGCAHFLRDGRVVLTDFDYARIPAAEGDITRHLGSELGGPYTAPEIVLDPATATKASDVWSVAKIGCDLYGADGDVESVPDEVRDVLRRSLSTDPEERPSDAELLLAELRGEIEVGSLFDEFFEPRDELDESWVVMSGPIGEGVARVYQLHNTTTQRDYAGKFVLEEYKEMLDPVEEYQLLFDVPDHRCLVKPEFAERMTKYRRRGRQHPMKRTFLVTRWVEGTRLDKLLKEKLAAVRCVELVLDLAGAVAHLHDHNLLHRDLKPQNVIVDDTNGLPRLVDFNVSRGLDAADRTMTGTPPYRPPDLETVGWGVDADTFALGVILCELLAGRLLRPGVRQWLDSRPVDALTPVLTRATAPKHDQRYRSVAELDADLRLAVDELLRPPGPIDPAPFPEAPAEELARPNWNPYQSRLVRLLSQSSISNAGTRGLDEFARWAYVETRIDHDLFPDVVRGKYRLVLITGNAGDGKTAFIQMLEQRLVEEGAEQQRRETGNGTIIERHGHRFVTNWDASQDEEGTENDEVLAEFFARFAGDEPAPNEHETRLVAVNEGRLIDFLSAEENASRYGWLRRTVLTYFAEQTLPAESGLAVVNLNLRALTLPTDGGDDSVVSRLLTRFADERLWQPCAACAIHDDCYARANAAMLRDPVLGSRAAERLRQTFDLVRLRRKLHITMRDLRSALAYVVAGNRTCDEIVRLVEDNDRESLLAGHAYNALFAASDKLAPSVVAPDALRDRLLAVVGTLDPAKTADPDLDARLWAMGVDALRPDPSDLGRSDRALLAELRERLPRSPDELTGGRARADLRLHQASVRRKLFLEREDPDWLSMYPYNRLTVFLRQLSGCNPQDRDAVVRAISNSEGLFRSSFASDLAVRLSSENEGGHRSFVVHDADQFTLEPLDRKDAATYVEYAPDAVTLRHSHAPDLALEIDLDLYEMLARVLDGFTPSREELRGTWLNLRIFKDQLATLPSPSLLLSLDDRRFYRLSRVHGAAAVAVEEE